MSRQRRSPQSGPYLAQGPLRRGRRRVTPAGRLGRQPRSGRRCGLIGPGGLGRRARCTVRRSTQEFALVPWNKRTLALPATPPSVRLARDWVTSVLREIGRDELADSARLAVSELVTNAILHAEPPMTVHVRGTAEHPRIEVTDQSLVPPQRSQQPLGWSTARTTSPGPRWGAASTSSPATRCAGARTSPRTAWARWSGSSRATAVRDAPAEGEVFTMDAALADHARRAGRPGQPGHDPAARHAGGPVPPPASPLQRARPRAAPAGDQRRRRVTRSRSSSPRPTSRSSTNDARSSGLDALDRGDRATAPRRST